MKKIIISILWIFILTGSVLLLWLLPTEWDVMLIIVLLFLACFFIIGIVTLIKVERVALIPLLLGGFALSCLCTVLEINHFFLISLLYLFGLMLYLFTVYENARTNNDWQIRRNCDTSLCQKWDRQPYRKEVCKLDQKKEIGPILSR